MSHPFEDLNPNQSVISHLQSHPAPEDHLPEGLTMALALTSGSQPGLCNWKIFNGHGLK